MWNRFVSGKWLKLAFLSGTLGGALLCAHNVCRADTESDMTIMSAPSAGSVADMSAINSMNDEFRQIYAQARQKQRLEDDPVIIATGDKVVLLRNGERSEYVFVPQDWSVLKSVDHVPLAAFVLLNKETDRTLSTITRNQIERFLSLVQAASAPISSARFPAAVTQRNEDMLRQTTAFLSAALSQGRVSREDLDAFARRMGVPALENADDAEKMELSRLDDQVQAWRRMLTGQQWQRLHVVIIGGHMPRQEERRFQYFAHLLGEKREGDRIIFQEGSDDENKALDLLATHILDAQIGKSFFNDPWRMHRDLLSDSARRYLKKHAPRTSIRD